MKFSTLISFVALAMASSAIAAPATTTTSSDDVAPENVGSDRLDAVRKLIQRYETPIIHAYLSRASLGGSSSLEFVHTNFLFQQILHSQDTHFTFPDANLAKFLQTDGGRKQFYSGKPIPPGTFYITPVTLPKDAILDKPVTGKGIYPTGRRPQDPNTVLDFVKQNLMDLPKDNQLDMTATSLLDSSILQLVSARIMLGYQVGAAKFGWLKDNYCDTLKQKKSQDKIRLDLYNQITDNKKEVDTLGRIDIKAKAFSKLYSNEPDFSGDKSGDVLRLFQAYVIPITKAVEVESIWQLRGRCDKK